MVLVLPTYRADDTNVRSGTLCYSGGTSVDDSEITVVYVDVEVNLSHLAFASRGCMVSEYTHWAAVGGCPVDELVLESLYRDVGESVML